MPALNTLFERFLRERQYLKNVTPKTLVWYETAWKSFRQLQPEVTSISKRYIRGHHDADDETTADDHEDVREAAGRLDPLSSAARAPSSLRHLHLSFAETSGER